MKKENAILISELLGIDPPEEIPGGTISKDWILSAVRQVPGCEEIDRNLTKADLLKTAIEQLGGTWDEECQSEGGTITTTALSRLASGIEPRIIEMREIWILLGKPGHPTSNHEEFISFLYREYFDREMSKDFTSSLDEILLHIDENHGLNSDEVFFEGKPTSSAYHVIINDLFTEDQDILDDEEDEFLTGIIRTSVTAESIDTLVNMYQRSRLNLNPPWQRGEVWSPKKKKAVVESIMLGIPLPAIILHKNSETGGHEVIDGQQRLRSIVQFVENKFPLAKFERGHDLYDVSGHYYDHDSRKSIDDYWRDRFALEKIPVLTFEDVSDSTLRKVFNLYNTASMKLNAAEIRNATYQTHPVHQMAFILAGENEASEIYFVDEEDQEEFTLDWKETGASTKRFGATELICQYFAYSRPQRSAKSSVFKGTSTANSINRFLDSKRQYKTEEISEMAQELIDAFYFAEENFDLEDGKNHARFRNDKNGVPKFNKLVTITNMVASRLLIRLLKHDLIEEDNISGSIRTVMNTVNFPDNQNAGTIWQYQADVINGLLDNLNLSSEDSEVNSILPHLVPCMDEIRSTE